MRTAEDGELVVVERGALRRRPRPRPGTAEAAAARPGTDALLVGEVDRVQVRVDSEAPRRRPTCAWRSSSRGEPVADRRAERRDRVAAAAPTTSGPTSAVSARATSLSAPQPTIFSRAQWGADERMRSAGSLRYGTVEAGFVHHTVNTNAYTRDDVPGILRSIYAYHTRSLGWSDIGYNFLVDRFGRIWEGRYGGVTRARSSVRTPTATTTTPSRCPRSATSRPRRRPRR